MTERYEEAARALLGERAAGARFHTLAPEWQVRDLDGAYAVQRSLVRLLAAATGSRAAGYKIGLTSKRMQAMCGIDHPIAGVVLADSVRKSGARLRRTDHHHLGLEFEICARLGRDLPPAEAPFDRAAVARAVDAVCAAIEAVDDRAADYAGLDCRSLVADNSWNAGVVLGEFSAAWPDLAEVTGVVSRNGVEIDRGRGADVLGHPFEPLTWLANHLANRAEGLRAGDIVMTGSLVTTRFPAGAERFAFALSGLGAVEAAVID